jgi:hypothetical protein
MLGCAWAEVFGARSYETVDNPETLGSGVKALKRKVLLIASVFHRSSHTIEALTIE